MLKPTAAQVEATGFRKAQPQIYPACRNCTHIVYDCDDRMTLSGKESFRRINLRCSLNGFAVQLQTVCDSHVFRRADRSDT